MILIFKRKKPNLTFSFTLPLLFICLGVFLGYQIFVDTTPPKEWTISDTSNKNLKFASEESLINEIRNVNKIIPLEIEMSESIVIDKSWGNFDVLKKFKKIKFFANCSYSIDLSNLTSTDIVIDDINNEISLTLPSPTIFSVDINEDKTVYEEVTNGLLRFGEVSLTSEEYGVIYREVTKIFENKLKDPSISEKAILNTTIALDNLIKQMINSDTKTKIEFKK
ncbi:DUF4230 domain-containing protein [Clostridium sp.]|uniref:DUF4230 domain-containing protein n=1 Tax=Clostridium sp. TaxID=1506 RepID=UPI003F3BEDCD